MNLIQTIEEGTILSVYKPLYWTSFDVVNKIKSLAKRTIPKLKIGHAGTLDPLAEGLLIVCTQRCTKQVEVIQSMPKTYIATIVLGANRPSYDKETEISEIFPTEHITGEFVEKALLEFRGKQEQIPPIYSAVKQDGKPLYLKARKGQSAEIKPKEIEIFDIELLDTQLPMIQVKITCSKGTYIRSLAFDIGKKLGCGAYLDHLIRSSIGEYSTAHSWTIDAIETELRFKQKAEENIANI